MEKLSPLITRRAPIACAGTSRHRDGAARRSRSSEGSPAKCGRAFGPKEAVARAGVSSPMPRSRSSRATWAGRRRRSMQRGRRSKRTATRLTPRMRGISRSGASLLIGRLDEAEYALANSTRCPSRRASQGRPRLVVAGIAMRRLPDVGGARCARSGRACRAPCADGRGRKRSPRGSHTAVRAGGGVLLRGKLRVRRCRLVFRDCGAGTSGGSAG